MAHMRSEYSGTLIRDLLLHAERRVAAEERRFIHENYGIGRSDFFVLDHLWSHGPLPVSVIGRKVLLTSGSITSAIDRMENRGFVLRNRNPDDRRISMIELTPLGRELIETNTVRHAELLEDLVSQLSGAEKSQLANILRNLADGAKTG